MPQTLKGQPLAGTRPWFRVQAKKDGAAAEVFIYDEIGAGFFGGGIAAADLIKEIKGLGLKAGDELKVRINSPGGNFFEGVTIHNYLRTEKAKIIVRVDGVAASAASVVVMAGDRIEMPQNAMLFIHNPWMFAAGDAKVMRKVAEDLDQMRDSAAGTYLRRAGDKLTRAKLLDMLDAETWLTAEDSVKHGLADVVDEPVRAAALAQFDFRKYGFPVPAALVNAKDTIVDERKRRREAVKLLKEFAAD